MAKADLKTKATEVSAGDFLDAVADPRRREEGRALDALYRKVTGLAPKMWGPSIVGYGSYTYTYDSGRSGTMARGGFSPRKSALTVYLDTDDASEALFAKLGPHSRGTSCLYIKRLDQVDMAVLEDLIRASWRITGERWPVSSGE